METFHQAKLQYWNSCEPRTLKLIVFLLDWFKGIVMWIDGFTIGRVYNKALPSCFFMSQTLYTLEVEHVQDFQFWHVALWRNHYNGCHIQVFSFPCYVHWIPNLSVICDQMHGNSLGEYPFPCLLYTPFCSTTRQCTRFGPMIKPCSFNLSLHQETKDKGRNDCNKRGKSLKRGDTHLLELVIIMYTTNPSCSGVYLSQVHGTRVFMLYTW